MTESAGPRPRIAPKSADPACRPYAVIMKSSDVCNFTCRYCYVENACETELMPLSTALAAIDKVLAYVGPGRRINLIWHGGEPLYAGRKFFEAIAEYCERAQGFLIENCIQTNGSLLGSSFLAFCKEHKFSVSVSIDGPQPLHDINRRTRSGNGTFERTMTAIARMRDAGLAPGCVCVLNKTNVDHIDDLYDFFYENRIHVRINPVVRSGRASIAYNELAISPLQYGEAMCRLFDHWFEDEYAVQIEPLHTILGNFIGPTVWGCDYHGRCLESIISVNPDGAIYPCGRFAGLEDFRLGSVLDQGDLRDVFAGEVFRRLTRRSTATVEGCADCEFSVICNAGCMVTAYMARHEIDDRDYYCEGRRMLFRHISQALDQHLQSITIPEGGSDA